MAVNIIAIKDNKKAAERGAEMTKEIFLKYTDEELLEQYGSQDAQVVDYLLEKYKPLVKKKARAMFLVGGDSEDLMQEGMIGLYKAIRDYEGDRECSFYTFADLCIGRQIYTAVTASNRKKHAPLNSYVPMNSQKEREDVEDALGHTIPNPEELFIDRESSDDLTRRINTSLSKTEKEVLRRYLQGKNYIEIAEELQKKPKQIDNTIQRIRKKTLDIYMHIKYDR